MKVIFLDIDGVLTTNEDYARAERVLPQPKLIKYSKEEMQLEMQEIVNEKLIGKLNEIVKATKAVVVIVSTWRKFVSYTKIEEFFKNKGFVGKVVGQVGTRFSADARESCTIFYLEENPLITHAVVIDDNSWERLVYSPISFRGMQQVKTDGFIGLTDEDVAKAIEFLNTPLLPFVDKNEDDDDEILND